MTTQVKAATHTPGPWAISGQLINGAPEPRPNPQVEPYPHAVAAANARLIAAAPELLEALQGLLRNCPPAKGIRKDFSYILYQEASRKAIAKAVGGAL